MVTFDELHKRDQALIGLLSHNADQTIQQLAKATKLSKDVVSYRLKRLKEKGVLLRRYAGIDFSALGYQSFRTYIKLQHTTPSIDKEIGLAIRKIQGLRIMGRMEGEFNYGWVAIARTPYQYHETICAFLKRFSKFIQRKEIAIMVEEQVFSAYAKKGTKIAHPRCEMALPQQYDNVDKIILKKLFEDSTISLIRLGALTDRTSGAVKNRIKRLEEVGIITRYKCSLNLGTTYYKLMINLEDINKLPCIYSFAEKHHRVTCCVFRALGGADVELDVFVESFSEFTDIIDKLKTELKDNLKNYTYHTFSALHVPKELEFV